jgi:hypothetical protein
LAQRYGLRVSQPVRGISYDIDGQASVDLWDTENNKIVVSFLLEAVSFRPKISESRRTASLKVDSMHHGPSVDGKVAQFIFNILSKNKFDSLAALQAAVHGLYDGYRIVKERLYIGHLVKVQPNRFKATIYNQDDQVVMMLIIIEFDK